MVLGVERAAGLCAALAAGLGGWMLLAGPASAQIDLGGVARGVVEDAVRDRAEDAVKDYLGVREKQYRKSYRGEPKREPAVRRALVDARDPEALREALARLGSATLSSTRSGDPRISGRMERALYSVRFLGCKRGVSCEQIVFSAGFAETGADLDKLNGWNRDNLYGRAFLAEGGDAVIEMTVNLRYGVSRENLDDTIDLWRVALLDFRDYAAGAAQP